MKRFLGIVLLVAVIILFSGCIQPPVCGNERCEIGENQDNCSADCSSQSPPSVQIFEPEINGLVVTQNGVAQPNCGSFDETYCANYSAGPDQNGTIFNGPIAFEWGDGSVSCSWFPAEHQYAQAGEYTISVSAKNTCTETIGGATRIVRISSGSCGNSICEAEETPQTCSDDCSIISPGVYELNIGDKIFVEGGGNFAGEILSITFIDVVQPGTGPNMPYQGKWTLKNNYTLLKIVQKAPGTYLNDEFGSNYFNRNPKIYVEEVAFNLQTEKYFAKVRITSGIEIRTDQVFPYDPAQTTNPEWTGHANTVLEGNKVKLLSIEIMNNWSYDQPTNESSTQKIVLAKNQSIKLPLDYGHITYEGLQGENPEVTETIGGNTLKITDTFGIQREVPLVIQLGFGLNEIMISGTPFVVYLAKLENTEKDVARYWPYSRTAAAIPDPWKNPPAGYNDISYSNKSVTKTTLSFWVNTTSMSPKYALGVDKTTGQAWLLLSSQSFRVKSASRSGILEVGSTCIPSATPDQRPYYLPDLTTLNVLTGAGYSIMPSDGDSYEFTSKMTLKDYDNPQGVDFYLGTSDDLLVNSTNNKARCSTADNEAEYIHWNLNEYTTAASTKLLQGYTTYGTKVTVSEGIGKAYVPLYTKVMAHTTVNISNPIELFLRNKIQDSNQFIWDISSNDVYSEKIMLEATARNQTIANGFYPGEVVLSIGKNGIEYYVTFNQPADIGTEINFMGKNYRIAEIGLGRVFLEEVQ
ncbi:MAG: hypothetical protein NTZ73_01725 [Candidatus Diapherotrites archaeon]|nr:hypothetical protein [Candidatus Diapherotrites archaeon]